MTSIFDWPWLLPLAIVLPVAIGMLAYAGHRRKLARLARFSAPDMLGRLVPVGAVRKPGGRALRLGAAIGFATLGLVGPRWGDERTIVRGEGVDVVLALDASLSMMATDERPTRLERMKQEVRRLRASGRGDRVALLAFAGRSYILAPLTVDDGALDLFLDNLDPSVVGQAGSSLARAIGQGTELLLATQTTGDRAIVLMSDGEAFEPLQDVVQAAERAAKAGISIISVGFGTAEGSTIPIREGERIVEKRDDENNIVVTKHNPELLRAASEAGQGTFVEASASDKAGLVRQSLQRLRGTSRAMESGRTRTPRFQWFLAPALLLLLLDTWLSERRGRRRQTAAASATAAGLVLLLSGCALRGDYAAEAAREYHAGRSQRAVALYRYALARGETRPELIYDLGTALVAADSFAAAVEPLERAARSTDLELQYRSLFNLGLAHLERGLLGDPEADSTKASLKAALAAYKRVLLMRSTDLDAKWNYELALRRAVDGGGGGGGGGDGGQSEEAKPEDTDTPQAEQPSGGLGQQQAEQLLNSAAREERGVQGRKQRQNRPPPPGGKDW